METTSRMDPDPMPCYRCLFMEDIKARICHPKDCTELTDYLLREEAKEETEKVCCPSCGSTILVKNGVTLRHGKITQRYKCKNCRKVFCPNKGFRFKRKHSNQVIQYAQSLGKQVDPAYSARDIAKMVKDKFGIKVSHTTIVAWLNEEDLMETT